MGRELAGVGPLVVGERAPVDRPECRVVPAGDRVGEGGEPVAPLWAGVSNRKDGRYTSLRWL
jgi:hypothetical protein